MAGRQTLDLSIQVRILVPQPSALVKLSMARRTGGARGGFAVDLQEVKSPARRAFFILPLS
jgi:hypothetical protein